MNIVCIRRISNEVSMNIEHSGIFQICSTRKKFEMYFIYILSRLLASVGAACLSSYFKWSFSEYHLHSSYFKWGFDKYIFSFHLKARTENKNVQICSASIKFDTIFSLWAMRYYFTRFLWAMVYFSTRLYSSRLHSMDLSREIFGIWRRTLKKTIKYKNKNQQPLAAEIGRSHAIFSWAFCHAISIWDSADYICQIWSIRNKFDIHNYVSYENLLNVILSRKLRFCHGI